MKNLTYCLLCFFLILIACKDDDDMNGPTVDPCEFTETGLVIETGLMIFDSIYSTKQFYLRETDSDFYSQRIRFAVDVAHHTEEIRWQIGTDPREFAGQTEVVLEFKVTGTIPIRVIAPRPLEDATRCELPTLELDTTYTQIHIELHPEPFTEMVGTYQGDSPLFPGETLEFDIELLEDWPEPGDDPKIVSYDFPEPACPQRYSNGDPFPQRMSVADMRFAYSNFWTNNTACGMFDAYFYFTEDNERVTVKFRHRFEPEDDWEHFVFEGERVE